MAKPAAAWHRCRPCHRQGRNIRKSATFACIPCNVVKPQKTTIKDCISEYPAIWEAFEAV
ncbi:MAG TPA: hypothetical protein DEQ45_12435 [Agrobacterium sp.]|nr:hypothetical protein [Agrobacterium sp.]